jgi:hypothetical protein
MMADEKGGQLAMLAKMVVTILLLMPRESAWKVPWVWMMATGSKANDVRCDAGLVSFTNPRPLNEPSRADW